MFERFTDRARRVVVLAQDEARALNHNYIGTEHILLGMLSEGEGVAARALRELDINLEAIRQQVEEVIGRGQHAQAGHIPFTPRAKKVLELSLRESLQLGHDYIGTEHILLGLIREGEGIAAQVLTRLGATGSRVRQQVMQVLEGGLPAGERAPGGEQMFYRSPTQMVSRAQLDDVIHRLDVIARRLSAIERRLGLTEEAPATGEPVAAQEDIAREDTSQEDTGQEDTSQEDTGTGG